MVPQPSHLVFSTSARYCLVIVHVVKIHVFDHNLYISASLCQELEEFWAYQDLFGNFIKKLSCGFVLELGPLLDIPGVKIVSCTGNIETPKLATLSMFLSGCRVGPGS